MPYGSFSVLLLVAYAKAGDRNRTGDLLTTNVTLVVENAYCIHQSYVQRMPILSHLSQLFVIKTIQPTIPKIIKIYQTFTQKLCRNCVEK